MNVQKHSGTISITLKTVIAALACWYIYSRCYAQQGNEMISSHVLEVFSNHTLQFLIVIILMPVNWLLESFKWKIIASREVKLSLFQAMKGVLSGVTIGTATPNRVGEFAGRIFSVESDKKKELLLLSFIASFCQILVTVVVGVIFVFVREENFMLQKGGSYFVAGFLILLVAIPFLLRAMPASWKTDLKVLLTFPPQLFISVLTLSLIRYTVYSTQFLLLLQMVVPNSDMWTTFGSIAVIYLAVTIIPTFSFTEIMVRGSVAGSVIGSVAHPSEYAFFVAAFLWLINVAVPSIIGIFFVFKLRFFRTK